MTTPKHKHPSLKISNLWFVILLLFSSSLIFGQKYNSATIENVSFRFNGENIEVTYDISNARPEALFSVQMEFYKAPGQLLNTTSVSGDIGSSVTAGAGKKIIWKSRQDGYILDADAFVKIKAQTNAYIPGGSHLAKSLFIPGWGDYRICNGKYHFVYGVAAYGSMGASIAYYFIANDNRANYLNSMDIEQRNNYYNTYTNQKTMSYVFAATAAAIWIYDIVKVAVQTSRLKNSITPERSTYYYDLSQKAVIGTSRVQYISTKTPYDLAMDEAKKLFDNKDYVASRNAYEKARNLNPDETLPDDKIAEIDKILAGIKALNDKYNAATAKGDSLLNAGKYEDAKNSFNTALTIKPDETYSKGKIAYIDTKLKEIALEKEYNANISSGDKAFNEKNYASANNFFLAALKLKPNAAYPTEKIQKIKQIQDKIEEQETDKEFKALIRQGDIAYSDGEYQGALNYYDDATLLKPDNIDAQNKLDKTFAKIRQMAQAEEEKNRKIEEQENEKKYNLFMKEANSLMASHKWPEALILLKKAKAIKNTEEIRSKIEVCESIIAGSFQKENDNNESNNTSNGNSNQWKAVYDKVEGAVFFIYAETYSSTGTGTGFFISSDGIAISNYHVYNKYKSGFIFTGTADNTEDKSKFFEISSVLEQNEEKDYVIFKVKPNYSGQKFPYLKISKTKNYILDNVLAIGNPHGAYLKVPAPGVIKQYLNEEFYILTDVDVTFGNSGGPLINSKGEVIGIMTSVEDEGRLGLNYAINIQKIPYTFKYTK